MKSTTFTYGTLALLATLAAGPVIAHSYGNDGQSAQTKRHHMMSPDHMGRMQGGMMGGMGHLSADELSPEQLDRIGEHLQQMHEQMEQIVNATDAAARREAVKSHLASMQAFMQARHDAMMEQAGRHHDGDQWHRRMDERMRRMEEMLQRKQ